MGGYRRKNVVKSFCFVLRCRVPSCVEPPRGLSSKKMYLPKTLGSGNKCHFGCRVAGGEHPLPFNTAGVPRVQNPQAHQVSMTRAEGVQQSFWMLEGRTRRGFDTVGVPRVQSGRGCTHPPTLQSESDVHQNLLYYLPIYFQNFLNF